MLYSHCSFGGGSGERWWRGTVLVSSRAEFWLAAVWRFPVPGLSSICHSKPFRLFWWQRTRPLVTLQNLRYGFQAVEDRGREKGEGTGRLALGSNVPQEINGSCSSQIKGASNYVRTEDRKRHGKHECGRGWWQHCSLTPYQKQHSHRGIHFPPQWIAVREYSSCVPPPFWKESISLIFFFFFRAGTASLLSSIPATLLVYEALPAWWELCLPLEVTGQWGTIQIRCALINQHALCRVRLRNWLHSRVVLLHAKNQTSAEQKWSSSFPNCCSECYPVLSFSFHWLLGFSDSILGWLSLLAQKRANPFLFYLDWFYAGLNDWVGS